MQDVYHCIELSNLICFCLSIIFFLLCIKDRSEVKFEVLNKYI